MRDVCHPERSEGTNQKTENRQQRTENSLRMKSTLQIVAILAIILLPMGAMGQFTTPTIDGTISADEYGIHTVGQNMSATVDGRVYYMTWDDTNLYIAVTGHINFGDAIVLYMDIDNPTPINSTGSGVTTGTGFDSVTPALPFSADFFAFLKTDYHAYKRNDGTVWGTTIDNPASFSKNFNDGVDVAEIRIPWSDITGGTRPTSFNFVMFMSYSGGGGGTFARMPSENEGGTTQRFVRYFSVASTADASATPPFSRNSYVFNSESDIVSFGSISIYDFTMNSAGRSITLSETADWDITGSMNIVNGSIDMGATTNHMSTDHLNLGADGSLTLSTAIGGDLKTSGNVTLNGTFTHNDRAVFFIDEGDQFLSKSTNDGVLEIPYVIVDKGNPSDRIFMGGTHLRITRKVTLTQGRLDSNSGSITFASNATHSASVDPSGTGDINLPFNVERHIAREFNPNGTQLLLGSPLPAPFTGSSAGLLSNVWTQGATGANVTDGDPLVFSYDETDGMAGWASIADLTTPTVRGKGYLVGLFKNDVNNVAGNWPKTLTVTGSWQASENDGSAVSMPVSFTSDAGENDDERGWNLVSNPFISTIDWNAASGWTRTNIENWYYTVTESGAVGVFNHTTDVGTEGLTRFIAPFQGFWVKASAVDPVLSMTDETKAPDEQASLHKSSETPAMWLELVSEDGHRVNTAISFRADGVMGRDANDAPVMGLGRADAMTIGSNDVESGDYLALQHLPVIEQRIEIPIVAKVGVMGGYTVSLSDIRAIPSEWNIVLRCERTGNLYDAREGESVTIGMTPGEESVFTLIIDPLNSTSTENGKQTTENFRLDQNYPNPFNPSTVIGFQLSVASETRLTVYDVLGRRIEVLVNGTMPAGSHTVTFDASHLTSGVYLYQLEAGGETLIRRMTLVK